MPALDWVDAPLPSPSALGGLSYGETDIIQNDAQRRSWEVLGQERDAVQGEIQRDKPLSDALSRDQGRYVGTEYGTVYDPPFRNIGWAGDAASALGDIVNPLGTARPISDQPSPYDEAVKQYPILQMQGVAAIPGGRLPHMEFWPANEPGTPDRPRPPNLPMNTPGVELGPNSRPIDVLGDIVSHHMVNKDPVIKKFYEGFTSSLNDSQREMLQAQYNYHVRNEGETRKYPEWEKSVGLPAYFRGYPFDQWPQDFNQEAYTPAQRDHLDKMMGYLREVQSAPGTGSERSEARSAQKTSAGRGLPQDKGPGQAETDQTNQRIQSDPYVMEELGIGGNPRPLSPDLPEAVRRQIAEEPSYSEYQKIPGKPNPLMEQEFEQGVHSGPQRDQALPEAIWRSRRYDDETNEPMPEGIPNYEYNPELRRPPPLDPRLYQAPMGQY